VQGSILVRRNRGFFFTETFGLALRSIQPACYRVIVLTCYRVTVLSCYCVIVLLCYRVTMLPCYRVIVLTCYRVIVLPCYRITVLSCYRVIVLSCYRVTVLSCYRVSFPGTKNNRNVKFNFDLHLVPTVSSFVCVNSPETSKDFQQISYNKLSV